MTRSESFSSKEQPFQHHDSLHINRSDTHGPVSWFSPTQTTFSYSASSDARSGPRSYGTLPQGRREEEADDVHQQSNISYKWSSRNARKGRHTLQTHARSLGHEADYSTPQPSNTLLPVLRNVRKMLTRFPLHDISYLTALLFVIGCILLVTNGFLTILPLLRSDVQIGPAAVIAQVWLQFVGCSLFLASSLGSWIEAVNANKDGGGFGWAPEQTVPMSSNDGELGLGVSARLVPEEKSERHRWNRHDHDTKDKSIDENEALLDDNKGSSMHIRLLPTLHELRTSYCNDLGFLACFVLLSSSCIFWTSSLASLFATLLLPTIAGPWIPSLQLIACVGFAVSSIIFAVETQDSWWKPAPHVLGWWIGVLNWAGSLGIGVFAGLAVISDEGAGLHYFWGIWAFFVGGLIQWYEALDKHPVEREA